MPRIKQSSIESIKNQVDLVDVVSPYTQLKRAGRSWKGLSPFAEEKTPSFYVHPDRGFYKCFSTSEGGDCFTFIMKQENLEFIEAVEFLARKFNINLEYEEGGSTQEAVSLRKEIFELHELATTWYNKQFLESEEAAPVREYWQSERGFTLETAKEIKIGYAPAAKDTFSLYCLKRKISIHAMHQSGLFFSRADQREHAFFKSRFRGRLMIPIRDVQGRVIAFTARKLAQTPSDDPAKDAKYINSPETPIFHKGRILFGMDHARKHFKQGDGFLLVEGQLDAIRCWSVGLHNTVAPQGTGITEDQVNLLRRYEPRLIECLLDGDSAGRKAALRAMPLGLKAGLEFSFLMLPEKIDPDDLLRKQGSKALDQLRKNAKNGIELVVANSLPTERTPTTYEKTIVLRDTFELLQNVTSQVAREDYVRIAAQLIGVDPQAALRDFYEKTISNKISTKKNGVMNLTENSRDTLLTRATWELLWLVLYHPKYANRLSEIIDYEWIDRDSTEGRLLCRLLAELHKGLLESSTQIEKIIDTVEERKLMADIQARELEVEDPVKQIEFCLERLRRKYVERQIKELEQKIFNTYSEERKQLMYDRNTLLKELKYPIFIKSQ